VNVHAPAVYDGQEVKKMALQSLDSSMEIYNLNGGIKMKYRMTYSVGHAAFLLIVPVIASGLLGCKICPKTKTEFGKVVMNAVHSSEPVIIDGKLDEPVWKNAYVYPMELPQDKIPLNKTLHEGGKIRLAWDENFLYIGFELVDSDIVAEGTQDNLLHYSFGDVGEVFLKPESFSWYWELYVTPAGRMSTLWFPGRGRLGLPSCIEAYRFDLKVAASYSGTLNKCNSSAVIANDFSFARRIRCFAVTRLT